MPTLGNNTSYSSNDYWLDPAGISAVPAQSGTLQSISLYSGGSTFASKMATEASGNHKFAIYDSDASSSSSSKSSGGSIVPANEICFKYRPGDSVYIKNIY